MKDKKMSDIVLAICLLVFGIFLVIWADRITKMVSILLGIVGILYAVMMFINYFKVKDKTFGNTLSFVYGIFILVIGFILIFRVNFLKELISFIVGIYIVLSSTLKLHEILSLQKKDNVKLNSSVIMTLVLILLGILCICGKSLVPDMIVRFIGVILVIYSVMFIVNNLMLKRIEGERISYEK